jgi:hypothetical protein
MKNYNIYAGDRAFRTNFFLQFHSDRVENRYRNDVFMRNKYALIGYVVLSFIGVIVSYYLSDCFIYYKSCKYSGILILSMLSAILAIYCIQNKKTTIWFIELALLIMTLYPNILFLDFEYYLLSLFSIAFYNFIGGKNHLISHL